MLLIISEKQILKQSGGVASCRAMRDGLRGVMAVPRTMGRKGRVVRSFMVALLRGEWVGEMVGDG